MLKPAIASMFAVVLLGCAGELASAPAEEDPPDAGSSGCALSLAPVCAPGEMAVGCWGGAKAQGCGRVRAEQHLVSVVEDVWCCP